MTVDKIQKAYRFTIAFVNDKSFYSNDNGCHMKMQIQLNKYKALYKATGGKIQEEKRFYYGWI